MDLNDLAYRQFKLVTLLKELDQIKKEIRAELFQEADEHFEKSDWLLPTVSWLVPLDFFDKTGMTREEFEKTRFPMWDIVSVDEKDEGLVYILKKKKQYMPWSYAGDEYEISRSVAELTPEIDWDAMYKAEPEMFKLFAKQVNAWELDVPFFNEYMNIHPEFSGAAFLTRYTKHKAPTLRVLSKEIKKNED